MLMVDGEGIPTSEFITSANHADVNTVETLVDNSVLGKHPDHLLFDRAVDADSLRDVLASHKIELVYLHRRGRKKPPTQDGRALRRYKGERTVSWLFNCRRLTVSYEYYSHLFEGFIQVGCLFKILNWFLN